MLKELTEVPSFLQAVATKEYIALAVDALQLLEDFAYQDHVMPILSCVSKTDNSDEAATLAEFNNLLFQHLDAVLTLHSVDLSENASLHSFVSSVKALLLIQSWTDKQLVSDLCTSDASPEEKFAAIVKETVGVSEQDTLDFLDSVDEILFERLGAVVSDDLPTDIEDPFVSPEQIAKIKAYRDFVKDNKLIAFRLVRLGYKIGYPFDRYLNKASILLDNKPVQEYVFEIIALILLGTDTWSGPINAWRDKTAILNLDTEERSRIDVALIRTLGEFELFSKAPKAKQ